MMVIRTYTIQELPTTTSQLWQVRKTRYPYASAFIGLFCSFSFFSVLQEQPKMINFPLVMPDLVKSHRLFLPCSDFITCWFQENAKELFARLLI